MTSPVDRNVAIIVASLRERLGMFVFKATSEAAFQEQVADVLIKHGEQIEREVIAPGAGRYDILLPGQETIVLELKLHAAAGPVERQVQRYAKMPEVDAVGVVTTSRRLAHSLGAADQTIGGKPFFVIAVRTS